jgi:hypothetical protein
VFTTFSVFLDACVLVPNWLRDILLTSAQFELYRPLWSAAILDEMQRTLIDRIGLLEERAKYTRAQMEEAFPEASVTGYEAIVNGMPVNEKDRHVLAAALVGHAQLIVTNNIRDFPQELLGPLQMRSQTADGFLSDLLARYPDELRRSLRFMTKNTGKTGNPQLTTYEVVQAIGATAPAFATAALLVFDIT